MCLYSSLKPPADFAVGGIHWEWDGTGLSATVKEQLLAEDLGSSASTEGIDVKDGDTFGKWVEGRGAEALSQAGTFVQSTSGKPPQRVATPIPCKCLGDKSAATLTKALEYKQTIDAATWCDSVIFSISKSN